MERFFNLSGTNGSLILYHNIIFSFSLNLTHSLKFTNRVFDFVNIQRNI